MRMALGVGLTYSGGVFIRQMGDAWGWRGEITGRALWRGFGVYKPGTVTAIWVRNICCRLCSLIAWNHITLLHCL